ncbi:hypothetical protein OC844_006104 [Tilletia horrida]|nr:hypothetical protein OC844_006104 [Tilletia horrida]
MSQRPVRAAKVQAVEKVRGMCKKVKRPRRATAPKPVPPPSAPGVTAAMNVASADGYTEAHFEIHDLLAARKGAGGQPEVLAKFLEWVPIQHLGDADEAQQQVAQLVQRQDGWTPPIIADNAVGILSDAPAPAATHTLTAMLTPPSSPRAVPVGVFGEPNPLSLHPHTNFSPPGPAPAVALASAPAPTPDEDLLNLHPASVIVAAEPEAVLIVAAEPEAVLVPLAPAPATPPASMRAPAPQTDPLNLHADDTAPAEPEAILVRESASVVPTASAATPVPQAPVSCDAAPEPEPSWDPDLVSENAAFFMAALRACMLASQEQVRKRKLCTDGNPISKAKHDQEEDNQGQQKRQRSGNGKANQKASRNRVGLHDI